MWCCLTFVCVYMFPVALISSFPVESMVMAIHSVLFYLHPQMIWGLVLSSLSLQYSPSSCLSIYFTFSIGSVLFRHAHMFSRLRTIWGQICDSKELQLHMVNMTQVPPVKLSVHSQNMSPSLSIFISEDGISLAQGMSISHLALYLASRYLWFSSLIKTCAVRYLTFVVVFILFLSPLNMILVSPNWVLSG